MPYFIIEHPTRGCVREIDPDSPTGARFTRADRRDAESVERYYHINEAMRDLACIEPRVRARCKVLESPDYKWRQVYPPNAA